MQVYRLKKSQKRGQALLGNRPGPVSIDIDFEKSTGSPIVFIKTIDEKGTSITVELNINDIIQLDRACERAGFV